MRFASLGFPPQGSHWLADRYSGLLEKTKPRGSNISQLHYIKSALRSGLNSIICICILIKDQANISCWLNTLGYDQAQTNIQERMTCRYTDKQVFYVISLIIMFICNQCLLVISKNTSCLRVWGTFMDFPFPFFSFFSLGVHEIIIT